MSTTARSERPINRWISTVRPPCFPLAASRSIRSGLDRGSIAYSAVTQPFPLPFIQRGTFSSTVAAHSTWVSPILIKADPSANGASLGTISTGRSSPDGSVVGAAHGHDDRHGFLIGAGEAIPFREESQPMGLAFGRTAGFGGGLPVDFLDAFEPPAEVAFESRDRPACSRSGPSDCPEGSAGQPCLRRNRARTCTRCRIRGPSSAASGHCGGGSAPDRCASAPHRPLPGRRRHRWRCSSGASAR